MKTVLIVLALSLSGIARAQSYEAERLILDIEKLAQLKNILTDLYKGYEILNSGYSAIKSISEGNFNLHQAFLTGLLAVSPAVKNYKRIADIIDCETRIISEYKAAFTRFQKDEHFNPDEIIYLGSVYNNLVSSSLSNLANLLNIVTPNKLRMSDADRLRSIDGVYKDINDKLIFLRQFNNSTTVLALQRSAESSDVQTLENLYGLK